MEHSRVRFGFKGPNQLPLFMVWREYYIGKEVTFAKVLFRIN